MRKKETNPFSRALMLCIPLLVSTICATNNDAAANVRGQFSTNVSFVNSANIKLPEIHVHESGIKRDHLRDTVKRRGYLDVNKVINLEEIILTASFVREKQSPLRLTTIDSREIERKGAGRTYPELMRGIPGVYATSETGSYGDAKINIRGFKQENISVMLNGIPISGLVTGNMFWNNWLGLVDATHSIQVQKGIGGSMLSDNSVGGTINIITKTAGTKAGASAGIFVTDYGLAKSFLSLNTGQNTKGWAMSAMASYGWGEAYPQMTDVSSWAYMVNISKRINSRNSLLFTVLGSPERHQQRSARLSSEEIENYGLRYNKNWGYLTGVAGNLTGVAGNPGRTARNLSENFYHKPYLTLHHFYKSGKNTEISNSIYLSVGNGGGRWSESKGKRIIDYRKDGLIDWEAVVQENIDIKNREGYAFGMASGSATNILSDYLAGHTQSGFKSNIKITPLDGWEIQSGVHYQYYSTWEKEKITDLLGGDFWYEDYANKSLAGVAGRNPVKVVGDYVRTNNGKTINHLTIYTSSSYKNKNWDIRAGVSAMGSTNQRWDKYNYTGNIASNIATGAGYSIKAGANRKLGRQSSLYLNAGIYSRVPYNDVFFSSGNNNITDDVKNEKNLLTELGYRYIFDRGSIEITGYYALWKNKSIISNPYIQPDNTTLRYMIRGLDALHTGVELSAEYKPTRRVKLDAYASVGEWRWRNDVSAHIYDDYSGVEVGVVNVYSNNLPVGDAPQTQLILNGEFEVSRNLFLNASWEHNARMYADFDPKERQNANDRKDPYKIPSYSLFNAGAGWNFSIGRGEATLYFSINNILNKKHIERGKDGSDHTLNSFRGFWGSGRNCGVGVRFQL
jgi:iron complex outermembrane recepter protein